MPIIMLTTRRPPDIPDWPSPPSIPYSPSLMPKDTAQVTTYILTQFEHLIRLSFFQPAYYQFTQFRDAIGCRLQHSDTALWTKYLACKIFESALDGTSQRKMPIYHRSLQNIELRLRSTPDQNLTVAESYNRLAGVLEVAFMKLMFSRGMSAYQLLRDEVPTFLQLVFTDPTLWPDPTNFSSISLARVLASTNYELSRFILLDALHSMALGLPQVIEYDTSTPPLHLGIWPSEWVHGCPIDLQFALVEINKRCNARIRVAPEPDWRPIEDRIKSWKPAVHALSGDDSWKTVATMVVQESWRHTLLIYLYMGVCGVKSDDDRVQASVQQVFQLIGSVDSFQTPSLSIHFLAQYLIAGACARSENQRDIAHKKLASAFHNAVWLIRGSDFVPVLDHLWHGAAANGQPIRWSDYVHSRQVMLPVPS
ncbi:hypothetical protein FRC08_005161 [Ceratobasidium sp. 394]|nr:hypothetical protein FRC08_005161 [Ceratobasidium sp. 394]